jgi:hypothetical protein
VILFQLPRLSAIAKEPSSGACMLSCAFVCACVCVCVRVCVYVYVYVYVCLLLRTREPQSSLGEPGALFD